MRDRVVEPGDERFADGAVGNDRELRRDLPAVRATITPTQILRVIAKRVAHEGRIEIAEHVARVPGAALAIDAQR